MIIELNLDIYSFQLKLLNWIWINRMKSCSLFKSVNHQIFRGEINWERTSKWIIDTILKWIFKRSIHRQTEPTKKKKKCWKDFYWLSNKIENVNFVPKQEIQYLDEFWSFNSIFCLIFPMEIISHRFSLWKIHLIGFWWN